MCKWVVSAVNGAHETTPAALLAGVAAPQKNPSLPFFLSSNVAYTQGCVKVSVCSDVPPSDEELAELAFEGKQPPPPLGYVRVPIADLPGLERR